MTKADRKADWSSVLREPVEFVRFIEFDGEHYDVYHQGPKPGGAIQMIQSLWTSMPMPVLIGIIARRVANLTGRCPSCDAVGDVATFAHDERCPAGNEVLRELLGAHGLRVADLFKGSRLFDPDPTSRQLKGRELWVLDSEGRIVEVVHLAKRSDDGK